MGVDIIEGLFLTLQTWGPRWWREFLLSLRSPQEEWSTILLPHPPSAGKEVQGAAVGGLGRGPYTAGALRENIRELRSARSDGSSILVVAVSWVGR